MTKMDYIKVSVRLREIEKTLELCHPDIDHDIIMNLCFEMENIIRDIKSSNLKEAKIK